MSEKSVKFVLNINGKSYFFSEIGEEETKNVKELFNYIAELQKKIGVYSQISDPFLEATAKKTGLFR